MAAGAQMSVVCSAGLGSLSLSSVPTQPAHRGRRAPRGIPTGWFCLPLGVEMQTIHQLVPEPGPVQEDEPGARAFEMTAR